MDISGTAINVVAIIFAFFFVLLEILTVRSIFLVRNLTFAHDEMRKSENLRPEWNPFIRPRGHTMPPLWQMLLRGILTAPFKFVGIVCLCLIAAGFSWITSPKTSLQVAHYCGNILVWIAGVSGVEWRGKEVSAKDAPLVIANHISWIDFMVLGASLKFGFVMSEAVSNVPLIGPGFTRMAKHVGSIVLDRHDAKSREMAKIKIKEKLEAIRAVGRGERLLIFSEGTLTNQDCVVPFKLGAFESLLPTQALRLEYSNPHCSLACLNVLEATLFFLSLGSTTLTLTWGDVVKPTKDETPETLAKKVQLSLVRGSRIIAADCGSYRDHLALFGSSFPKK